MSSLKVFINIFETLAYELVKDQLCYGCIHKLYGSSAHTPTTCHGGSLKRDKFNKMFTDIWDKLEQVNKLTINTKYLQALKENNLPRPRGMRMDSYFSEAKSVVSFLLFEHFTDLPFTI